MVIKLNENFNANKKLFWKEIKKEKGVGDGNVRIERGWSEYIYHIL